MFGKVKESKYDGLAVEGQPYSPYRSKPYDRTMVLMDLDGVTRTLSEEYPGADIDFRKLLIEAVDGRNCIAAFAVYTESGDMSRRRLLREVAGCGFRLEPVPDEGSKDKNIGAAMAIRAQEYALRDWCDTVVLITGDESISHLVRAVQRMGKVVDSISFDEASVADKAILMSRIPLVRVDVSEGAGL